MTSKEIIKLLKAKKPDGCSLEMHYQNLLEQIGGLKRQYYDYQSNKIKNNTLQKYNLVL